MEKIRAAKTAYNAGKAGIDTIRKAKVTGKEWKNEDMRGMVDDAARDVGRQGYNHATETGKTMGKTWLKTFEVIPRMVCRSLQFLFAIIACGFYGNRVQADAKEDEGYSPEWLFAITVAGLSATTAVLFIAATPLGAIPFIGSKIKLFKTYRAFPLDLALFVSWLVVFGIFAGIFLHRDDDDGKYKGASTGAMKTAVWIDFLNVLFWLTSGVYGAIKTFLGDKVDEMTNNVGQKIFEKKQKTQETKEDYAQSV